MINELRKGGVAETGLADKLSCSLSDTEHIDWTVHVPIGIAGHWAVRRFLSLLPQFSADI